jgi:hypothetical protein
MSFSTFRKIKLMNELSILISFAAKHNKRHLLTELSCNIKNKAPISNIMNLIIWESNGVNIGSQDNSVIIVAKLRAEWQRNGIWVSSQAEVFLFSTVSRLASCPMGTGLFPCRYSSRSVKLTTRALYSAPFRGHHPPAPAVPVSCLVLRSGGADKTYRLTW